MSQQEKWDFLLVVRVRGRISELIHDHERVCVSVSVRDLRRSSGALVDLVELLVLTPWLKVTKAPWRSSAGTAAGQDEDPSTRGH